jgi:hypothetical protein
MKKVSEKDTLHTNGRLVATNKPSSKQIAKTFKMAIEMARKCGVHGNGYRTGAPALTWG